MARAKLIGMVALCVLAGCADGKRQQLRTTGGQLAVEPSLLDLGAVALGKEARRTVTLRNDGVATMRVDAPAQLLSSGIVGEAPSGVDFTVVGLPLTLKSGQSAEVEVRFHPVGTGDRALQLPLRTDSALDPEVAMPVSGLGVLGLAQLTADQLDFGDVVVGETGSLTLALVNNEKATTEVRISALEDDAAHAFNSGGVEGAITLKPDEQIILTLRFAPQKIGAYQAALEIFPCPTCSSRSVRLSGGGALRLVDIVPAAIDFGDVVAGTSADRRFELVNRAKKPITVQSIAAGASPGVKLALDGGRTLPVTLAADEHVAGTATFAPDSFGARAGKIAFSTTDGAPPELSFIGFGFGAQANATPQGFSNFAAVVGTSRSTELTVTNTGLDPKAVRPLAITSATIEGADAASWSAALPTLPWTLGEPGAQGVIRLTYAPTAVGPGAATLVLASNDALHPAVRIPLGGLSRELPPCEASVLPAPVDFGNVGLGRPVTAGFEVINQGSYDCILGDPTFTSGQPAFHWPGDVAPKGRTVPPGGRASVRVQFTPDHEGDFAGQVELYISNKQAPTLSVRLQGHGASGCFSVNPATLDFGSGHAGCGIATQSATLRNQCKGAITIDALSIAGAFQLAPGAPAGSFTLAAGQNMQVPISYGPKTPGDDVGQLIISTSASATPYTIGLTGLAAPDERRTDEWDQSTPKVDLLFVIDNSGSTAEEQTALTKNLDALWARIALANADFHIAVTTTGMYPYTAGWSQCPGGAQGGEGGRFFPVDGSHPRILTPQTPDVKNALIANMNVGQCHWDERFTEPVLAALTPPLSTSTDLGGNAGFLRDDARLALLAISDADDSADESNPPTVQSFVDQLRQIKHGALDLVSFSGIVALTACPTSESVGTRYREIATALSGHLEDICDLDNMGKLLDRSLDNLLAPLSSFPLSALPRDPATISVTVDGAPAAGFTYDPASNRIVFAAGSVPAPGSHVAANYEVACP